MSDKSRVENLLAVTTMPAGPGAVVERDPHAWMVLARQEFSALATTGKSTVVKLFRGGCEPADLDLFRRLGPSRPPPTWPP